MSRERCNKIFICYTPLHIIIAENIIEKEGIKDFIFIFYYLEKTKKFQLYYNRLAKKAQYSFLLKKDNKLLTFIKVVVPFVFKLRKLVSPHSIVYSGSVKTAYSRFIIFGINSKRIRSFDDGAGNIDKVGYYYDGRGITFFNLLTNLVGLDFSYARMHTYIEKHYTIYPNIENAMPNAEEVVIFNHRESVTTPKEPKISLFLLTVFFEAGYMDEKMEIKLFDRIIKEYNIEHVIPHPASNNRKLEYFKKYTIESDKIAEEIIFDLQDKYEQVIVYGFHSSVLINLMNTKGVVCKNIKIDGHKRLQSLGEFVDSLNIETVSVDLNTLE